MSTSSPIFSIFCIDYRYDALVSTFYEAIGQEFNYFSSTVAGGALPLGYKKYCKKICNSCNKIKCDPKNTSMDLLKKNLVENLNIALTLKPIKELYLINHQDCGAIKEFLSCSGYPQELGANNKKEIIINSKLLVYSNNYMLKIFPEIKNTLCLIDINGTLATYDILTKTWTVIYIGEFNIAEGLWYGLKKGQKYKL